MPSSYKTPNFALNQWLGTDTFARTDFNADNLAIDAALKRLSDDTKVINPLSNNLYNLILQHHYEGKYTGYKKALMFDGLKNYSLIKSLSEGLYLGPTSGSDMRGNLTFDNVGYTNFETASPDAGEIAGSSRTWTPDYCTVASDITLFFYVTGTNAANGTVTVTIKDDKGNVVGIGTKVGGLPVGAGYQTYVTIPFSSPVYFIARKTYTISVECTANITLRRANNDGGYRMYFKLTCSPLIRSTGTCVSIPADMGNDYTRAIGWVRHSGGAAGLGLDVGETSLDFTLVGTQPAYTVDGVLACTESSFNLDIPAGLTGETAVRLILDKNGDVNMVVYDYGVMFI